MTRYDIKKIYAKNAELGYRPGSPRFIWPPSLVSAVARDIQNRVSVSEVCRRYAIPRAVVPRLLRVAQYHRSVRESGMVYARGARRSDYSQLPIRPYHNLVPKPKDPEETPEMDSRQKGLNFERQIVTEFRARGWTSACRQIETNPDAVLGIDLLHTDPFSVQCKYRARYVSINTINEVPPLPGRIPVLITKGSADAKESTPMVVLPLSDFLALVSPSSPARPRPEDF